MSDDKKKQRPAFSLDFTAKTELDKKKADSNYKVQRVRGIAVWKNKFGYSVTLSDKASGAAILAWLRDPAKFQEDYFVNVNVGEGKTEQKAAEFAANYTSDEIEGAFDGTAALEASNEETIF